MVNNARQAAVPFGALFGRADAFGLPGKVRGGDEGE